MTILLTIKKCLILVIILLRQYYDDSVALVVGKMEDKMGGVAATEFVG